MAVTDSDMRKRLAVLEAKMHDFNSELHVDGLLVSRIVKRLFNFSKYVSICE